MEQYANALWKSAAFYTGMGEIGLSIADTYFTGKAGRRAIDRDLRDLRQAGEMRRQKLRDDISAQRVALSMQGRVNSGSAAILAARTAQEAEFDMRGGYMKASDKLETLKDTLATKYINTVATGARAGLRLYKVAEETQAKERDNA